MWLPLLILFDFMTAFPSIAHNWLSLALHAARLPQHMINLHKGLYTGANNYMNADGQLIFFFVALSGVLQGDPSSGTLFVIALKLFCRAAQPDVPTEGDYQSVCR